MNLMLNVLPGVDDMVGLLLSLSATPEELDILLISVTYGNVPLKKYDVLPKLSRS
jgi:inosine-uridine nucleoside N-ribohydrolase